MKSTCLLYTSIHRQFTLFTRPVPAWHGAAIECLMSSPRSRGVSGWVVLTFVCAALWPACANTPSPANLPLAQILASMEHRNQIQREALRHYHAVRQYHVEYQGITTCLLYTSDAARKNSAIRGMRRCGGAEVLDKAGARQQARDSQGLQRADLAWSFGACEHYETHH